MSNMSYLPTIPSLLVSKRVPLIHRDLSWLQFNERVLDEARQNSNPLLERIKFLAISASNLDEFFMIRAAALQRSIQSHRRKFNWHEARRDSRILVALLEAVAKFSSKQIETLDGLCSELEKNNLFIIRRSNHGDEAFDAGRELFEAEVLPKLLSPESFAVPKLNQLENMQMAVIFPGELWMKIPPTLPSMVFKTDAASEKTFFFFLDDLLATHLYPTFPKKWAPGFVRLTRDGDFTLDFQENDPESIPDVVMTKLGKRDKGRPVRLQYSGTLPNDFLSKCQTALHLSEQQIIPAPDTMCVQGLWKVVNQCPDKLRLQSEISYPPLVSRVPKPLQNQKDIFEKLKQRDLLLHHPYDSFESYVAWVRCACEDPNVEMIEQTVYRVDTVSPVVPLLKQAAKTKRVRVVIELRARFDELNNLRLADELKKAGVEVAFGFGALKLHAKVALVTRNEPDGKKLYTHLSTGNYNAATARQYTDLAILTAHPEIGADARLFFDSLWRGEIPSSFKQLVIAPTKLARRVLSHIQAEASAARQGKKARIFAKVNALVDKGIIESLYHASQAGVQVDLVVRGACSLVPGVRGLSENIRVVSIVDRFLEHSRIYHFESSQKMYLSSADWMPRNFFSRLEIAFPVLDKRIYTFLEKVVLPAYLSDTVKARELTHQGIWKKRTHSAQKQHLRSQVFFRELALHDYKGTPLE
jgi:polyphosphate kinase